MINLRASDLYIKDITNNEGKEVEVVSLKNGIAFDTEFINECKEAGVRKFEKREEE